MIMIMNFVMTSYSILYRVLVTLVFQQIGFFISRDFDTRFFSFSQE